MTKAISIGAAGNTSSLQPHKQKDPLDFITQYVLNYKNPQRALELVMIGIIKHAHRMVDAPTYVVDEALEMSADEQIRLNAEGREAAAEFLDKLDKAYPNPQGDEVENKQD